MKWKCETICIELNNQEGVWRFDPRNTGREIAGQILLVFRFLHPSEDSCGLWPCATFPFIWDHHWNQLLSCFNGQNKSLGHRHQQNAKQQRLPGFCEMSKTFETDFVWCAVIMWTPVLHQGTIVWKLHNLDFLSHDVRDWLNSGREISLRIKTIQSLLLNCDQPDTFNTCTITQSIISQSHWPAVVW